jgi:hypothetical protein
MIPEVFVDGIGRIGLVEGMIRIELISRSGAETDEQGRPKPEVRQRLIMSLNAFLQGLQAQQSVIAKLQEAGVLRVEPQSAGPAVAAPAPAAGNGAAPAPPKSPNFSGG